LIMSLAGQADQGECAHHAAAHPEPAGNLAIALTVPALPRRVFRRFPSGPSPRATGLSAAHLGFDQDNIAALVTYSGRSWIRDDS
jgi:hypothetical protein